MKKPTKDLFDETTMTFGEHLEVLRVHLIRAILGLVVAVLICLYFGGSIVTFIRRPIDRALSHYAAVEVNDDVGDVASQGSKMWDSFVESFSLDTFTSIFVGDPEEEQRLERKKKAEQGMSDRLTVRVNAQELAAALHTAFPERFPAPEIPESTQAEAETAPDPGTPPSDYTPVDDEVSTAEIVPEGASTDEENPGLQLTIPITLRAPEFAQLQRVVDQSQQAVTLKVEEAFMTYLKVSLITGLILASPWIFYQLWLFVAAGLYPHEQKYVYLYGTMSLVLFLAGASFCFFVVFPFVLNFLLTFNRTLEIHPQIRLSEWISFAVMLPLMFGISFQLPLVMLFLERIGIFDITTYRQQRRMAILVIAIISTILTPQDPTSMLLMFLPLVGLYEFGIWLCKSLPRGERVEFET